jgi:hypothetical protein
MEKDAEAVGQPFARPHLQDAREVAPDAGWRARQFARVDANVKNA